MPFDPASQIEYADTTLGVLLRARQRIAQGWVQDKLECDDSFCAVGSVHADGRGGRRSNAMAYLYRALPWWYKIRPTAGYKNLNSIENRIAGFNDARGRTQGEVLALYDRAIAMYKADSSSNRV